jgi:hypothetical protein
VAPTDCKLLEPESPPVPEGESPPPPPPQPTNTAVLIAMTHAIRDSTLSDFDHNMNALALRNLTQRCRHLKPQLERALVIDDL